MRSIAKAQYGMSRDKRRQYTRSTGCVSPNDPGCGRSRRSGIKSNRQIKKEQDEISRRVDEQLREKEIMRNGIVKREYLREDDDRPGTPSGYDRQEKMWKGENVAAGENQAKKGVRVKRAQTGIKTTTVKTTSPKNAMSMDELFPYGKTKTVRRSGDRMWKDKEVKITTPSRTITKSVRKKTLLGKLSNAKGRTGKRVSKK